MPFDISCVSFISNNRMVTSHRPHVGRAAHPVAISAQHVASPTPSPTPPRSKLYKSVRELLIGINSGCRAEHRNANERVRFILGFGGVTDSGAAAVRSPHVQFVVSRNMTLRCCTKAEERMHVSALANFEPINAYLRGCMRPYCCLFFRAIVARLGYLPFFLCWRAR